MSSTAVEIPGYVAGTWAIDPVHSEVSFTVRHMMVSKVRRPLRHVRGHHHHRNPAAVLVRHSLGPPFFGNTGQEQATATSARPTSSRWTSTPS